MVKRQKLLKVNRVNRQLKLEKNNRQPFKLPRHWETVFLK